MNTQKVSAVLMSVLATVVLLARALAAADEYPTRPISLVLGYPPGGAGDVAARAIAEKLRDVLGQPLVIEYKPGAGGAVAAAYAARSAPNGYTLLMCVPPHLLTLPMIRKDLGYTRDDFVVLSSFSTTAVSFNVRADSKWQTLKEFVRDAKENPGKYSYATFGTFSGAHLGMELLSQKAGIKLIHVPYPGSPQANTALLGGHVDISATTGTGGLYEAGKLRILAVASDERFPPLPKVPSLAELGYPGITMHGEYSICVPKRTPEAIVQKLDNAIGQIFAKYEKELSRTFAIAEQAAIYYSRDKITAMYAAKGKTIKDLLDSMGVKPE